MEPQKIAPRLHNEVYPFIQPAKLKNCLDSQIVIITGALGTIGQAIAKSFAVAGSTLILCYNRSSNRGSLEEECIKLGAKDVHFFQCDVSDLENCRKLIQYVETIGEVDILVNNAGTSRLRAFHSQDPNEFTKEISINLNGPFYLIRLVMPSFMKRRRGCVLNIASRGGTIDFPLNISYSTSKAGLIRMTSCIQEELKLGNYEDIHLYALHPGSLLTNMVDVVPDPSLQEFPQMLAGLTTWLKQFKDSPYLCGMTCVALATGIAKKVLAGKYVDVQQDLEDVLANASEFKQDPRLHTLYTTFSGGLPNDGGTEKRDPEPPFAFPGW